MEDVAKEITEKLVRRHPHVFPAENELEEAKDIDQMASTWEQIKKKEKNRSSVFEGIPKTLPALSRASKVLRKASTLGINQISVEIEPKNEEAFGEVLLGLVEWARINEIDPEETLRVAVEQYVEKAKELE